MADNRDESTSSDASSKHSTNATSNPPQPSYSAWRTAAHLYFPFLTVLLFMILGSPFETIQANIICVLLSAIPTNWLASFFYPLDRPEPTPEQAVRFSRRSDIYRAAILFTYRWLFGTPFNLQFFCADFLMSYGLGNLIGERLVGTKPRRSEFGVHLLWMAGSSILMVLVPSFLTYWVTLADRVIWRATYIALVDDIVGVLGRPNLKTWKGKVRLVLVQCFVIFFSCWMLLRWKRDLILAYANQEDDYATLAALEVQQEPVGMGDNVEDDGDRFLT